MPDEMPDDEPFRLFVVSPPSTYSMDEAGGAGSEVPALTDDADDPSEGWADFTEGEEEAASTSAT